MSLIKCSECGKEISDHAESCPSCGNPIHKNMTPVKKIEVVGTSKKWKWTIIVGVILLFVALIQFANSSIAGGFGFLFLAFIFVMIGNIGGWWTNG
jgi:hypothetical protein